MATGRDCTCQIPAGHISLPAGGRNWVQFPRQEKPLCSWRSESSSEGKGRECPGPRQPVHGTFPQGRHVASGTAGTTGLMAGDPGLGSKDLELGRNRPCPGTRAPEVGGGDDGDGDSDDGESYLY